MPFFTETLPIWSRLLGRGVILSLFLMPSGPAVAADIVTSADICDGSTVNIDSAGLFVRVGTGDVFIYAGGIINIFDGIVPVGSLSAGEPFTVSSGQNGHVLEFRVDGSGEITCTAGSGAAGNGATVTVQAGVTQTAINTNVAARFGGGAGVQVGQDTVFISTRGLTSAANSGEDPAWNAWMAYDARRFHGESTGDSRNISFGLDHLVTSDLLVGGFVGRNDQSVTTAGATTDTSAPLIGIYAAQRLRDRLYLSGFLGQGQPKYTTDTTEFTARRTIFGLTLTGETQANGLTIQPTATMLASQEQQPATSSSAADTLKNLQIKFDGRIVPVQRLANGLLPYLSLGAEYRVQSSQNNGTDRFLKPRLGLGFDWTLAAGTLRADLDAGAVTSGTYDMGGSLVYVLRF